MDDGYVHISVVEHLVSLGFDDVTMCSLNEKQLKAMETLAKEAGIKILDENPEEYLKINNYSPHFKLIKGGGKGRQ